MEKRQGGRKGWKDGGIVEGEKEGEMKWWRGEGGGYYPASIYSSQGWLDA